jgi:hypothetical protein
LLEKMAVSAREKNAEMTKKISSGGMKNTLGMRGNDQATGAMAQALLTA